MSQEFNSIEELRNNRDNYEELKIITNLDEIAPKTENRDNIEAQQNFFKELDRDLEKSIQDTNEILAKALDEKVLKEELEEESKDLNGNYSEPTLTEEDEFEPDDNNWHPKKLVKVSPVFESSDESIFDGDTVDFSDEDINDIKSEKENEDLETIKAVQKSFNGIKPFNVVDISSFTLSKKHITANNAIRHTESSETTVDWVLLNTGVKVTMREFKGYELEALNPQNADQSKTRFNMFRDIYKLIYNHIVDENKVPFDVWIKSVKFVDLSDLYFAVYMACFSGANSIPYACTNPKCKHVFMSNYKFSDMVKYKNDEAKEKVQEILNGENYVDGTENVEIVMISDQYAVGIKSPSIYNIIFEPSLLDEKFSTKYADFLSYIAYIDEVYYIDKENHELIPIDTSINERNVTKEYKNKIMQYSKVFRTLSSDQLMNFRGALQSFTSELELIDYVIPSATCPKCATILKEEITEPESMLFIRQQLHLIANLSIK